MKPFYSFKLYEYNNSNNNKTNIIISKKVKEENSQIFEIKNPSLDYDSPGVAKLKKDNSSFQETLKNILKYVKDKDVNSVSIHAIGSASLIPSKRWHNKTKKFQGKSYTKNSALAMERAKAIRDVTIEKLKEETDLPIGKGKLKNLVDSDINGHPQSKEEYLKKLKDTIKKYENNNLDQKIRESVENALKKVMEHFDISKEEALEKLKNAKDYVFGTAQIIPIKKAMKKYQNAFIEITINDVHEKISKKNINLKELHFRDNRYTFASGYEKIFDKFTKNIKKLNPDNVKRIVLVNHAQSSERLKNNEPFDINKDSENFNKTLITEKEWEEARFMLTLNRARAVKLKLKEKMGDDYDKFNWKHISCGTQCPPEDDGYILRTQVIIEMKNGETYNTDEGEYSLSHVLKVFKKLKETFSKDNVFIQKYFNDKDYLIPAIYVPPVFKEKKYVKKIWDARKTGEFKSEKIKKLVEKIDRYYRKK